MQAEFRGGKLMGEDGKLFGSGGGKAGGQALGSSANGAAESSDDYWAKLNAGEFKEHNT